MRRFLFIPIISLFLTLCLLPGACSPSGNATPDYIRHLDSLVEIAPQFEKLKQLRIDELMAKLNNATLDNDRYTLNSLLFEEYLTLNSDSAVKYIDRCIEIAHNSGNWKGEAKGIIQKSEFLTSTGLLVQASELIKAINSADLPKELLPDYYGQMIYLYSHLGNYEGGESNRYYIKERAYKDSVMAVIDESHPMYLWYKGWDALGTDKPVDSIISALSRHLENSSLSTHNDAKNAYILAMLYRQAGDHDNYMRALAMSAEADVKIANSREMSSFEELARTLFDNGKGDIDHAYLYMNYCLNKAIGYPNRVKAYLLSESMSEVNETLQQRSLEQQRRTSIFLILACVLAGILLISLIFNIMQIRKLRRQGKTLDESNKSLNANVEELSLTHRRLNEANEQLQDLITDLKAKNDELNEANYVKEEYICNIFSICSNYISKMSELKKNIHLKVLGKKYKDIEHETEDFDMKNDFKEFYRSFDTVFLHIYPDFIRDFNELLEPDKRIYPKDGELLNTELRIYALIRLGITDSVKIAEFMHISAQTVYNNRFKVRNRAIIPRNDFADTVRHLGEFSRG